MMQERRARGTKCSACGSTSMEMFSPGSNIVYRCLRCAFEWPERRIAAVAPDNCLRQTEDLHDAVRDICAAHEVEQWIDVTRGRTRALLAADGVAFIIQLADACYCADDDPTAPFGNGRRDATDSAAWALNHRQTVIVSDLSAEPQLAADESLTAGARSLLIVPVRKPFPVGAMVAYWRTEYRPSQHLGQVAELLADAAAVAFARHNLFPRLQGL